MGQRPRTLHPGLSALHLFGARLRLLREQRGLSQRGLGQLVFCSGHLIGKIEKGERRPLADLAHRCDEVLGAGGTLIGLLPSPGVGRGDAAPDGDVLGHLPALRQALDTHDLPDDGPVRPLPELRREVGQVVQQRLDSRYVDLAACLPVLLPELHRARQMPGAPTVVAGLLTQAYRAADAIADKFGLYDLSARIIELMRGAAAATGDEALVAATSYVRAETFFASGAWTAGCRMLEHAADTLSPGQDSPARVATYGSLHMRAAVLAARSGDHGRADDHLSEAVDAAGRVSEGVYRGTAFGPASVRIHQLSLAVDLADTTAALRAAQDWIPPQSVPAERRSHFFVDHARAQLLAARPAQALESLATARQIAPQHMRQSPEVQTTVAQLLATVANPSDDLLGFARWVGALTATGSGEEDRAALPTSR